MVIRDAQPTDAGAIRAIYAHYVDTSAATFDQTAPSADEVAAKIAGVTDRGLPFLVAETHGEVSGYAYLAPYNERSAYRYTAEVSVYVAPDARGRGVGRSLLEHLLDEGALAGIREVVAIITATDALASVALHRACGFREAGRLTAVGHKHGRWHDTLLMQRSLARENQRRDTLGA